MQLVRMRSPIHVRGSLRHPAFGVDSGRLAAQAGGAVLLGVALTPVAALIALVDPGLAEDADCFRKSGGYLDAARSENSEGGH